MNLKREMLDEIARASVEAVRLYFQPLVWLLRKLRVIPTKASRT